jgi:hypothetical protein
MGGAVESRFFKLGGLDAFFERFVIARLEQDQFVYAFSNAHFEIGTDPWSRLGEVAGANDLGLELLLGFLALAHFRPV